MHLTMFMSDICECKWTDEGNPSPLEVPLVASPKSRLHDYSDIVHSWKTGTKSILQYSDYMEAFACMHWVPTANTCAVPIEGQLFSDITHMNWRVEGLLTTP